MVLTARIWFENKHWKVNFCHLNSKNLLARLANTDGTFKNHVGNLNSTQALIPPGAGSGRWIAAFQALLPWARAPSIPPVVSVRQLGSSSGQLGSTSALPTLNSKPHDSPDQVLPIVILVAGALSSYPQYPPPKGSPWYNGFWSCSFRRRPPLMYRSMCISTSCICFSPGSSWLFNTDNTEMKWVIFTRRLVSNPRTWHYELL